MTRVELDGVEGGEGGVQRDVRRGRGGWRGERSGGVSPKVLLAGLVAFGGMGAATWSIMSLQRPARTPRIVMDGPGGSGAGPRAGGGSASAGAAGVGGSAAGVSGGGGEPGAARTGMAPGAGLGAGGGGGPMMAGIPAYMSPTMVERYEFPRVRDAADVRRSLDEMDEKIAGAVASSGGGESAFSWMGLAQQDRLVEAVRLAVEPLVIGSAEDFAGAVQRLKGVDSGDPPRSKGMFDRLSPVLAMPSLDLSNLRVSPVDTSQKSPMPRRAGMSMMSIRTRGDGGEENRLSIVSLGTDELFPGVADFMETRKRAVEVRVPLRGKDSKEAMGDLDLSLVMVWNEKEQAWQPADYRLFVRNGEVGRRLAPERSGG